MSIVVSFVQYACLIAGFGLKATLLVCPHGFKIGQFVVGRAGRHDDDVASRSAIFRCEPGECFVVRFAGRDFNDVGDCESAAPFDP
jgi:hypothetical protein